MALDKRSQVSLTSGTCIKPLPHNRLNISCKYYDFTKSLKLGFTTIRFLSRDQFKKIVKRYIRVGYNLDIMRQSACLVLNPITVYSYGFLFNCTTVGQASDFMTALT